MKNVCVFASSSNNLDSNFYVDAEKLGVLLGKNGYNIVYGGSRLGMMYACAGAVKNNGGKIIGIMPKKLYELGYGNADDCAEFILTDGMRERKGKMDELSDAVIALAGGLGTLEEISEMIVQKQLGYTTKPIIILNTNNYYNNLIAFIDNIISQNFAKNNVRELFFVANSPEEAVNYLNNYKPAEYAGKF